MSLVRCLKIIASRLIEGIKTLSEENPSFFELTYNYEEYHEVSHITPMTLVRLKLIENWIEEGSTALDVGCGEGFVMDYLAKKKRIKVKGIDISKRAVELCRSKGFEAEVRDVDLQGLGLHHNEYYDYILFVEVLGTSKASSQSFVRSL